MPNEKKAAAGRKGAAVKQSKRMARQAAGRKGGYAAARKRKR